MFLLFSPRKLGRWSKFTHILQMGWNHQLGVVCFCFSNSCLHPLTGCQKPIWYKRLQEGKKPHQSILIWGKLMIWVYRIGLKPYVGKLLVLLAHFPRLWVLRNWKNSKRILAIMVLPFGDTYIYVYISYIHWKRERERDPSIRGVGRCWWFITSESKKKHLWCWHYERL